MNDLKVGDRVIRKDGRIKTVGTIQRIYRPYRYSKPEEMRADVLWHGANRRRLGATSDDKRGSIRLSSLCYVCQFCNAPALPGDIFCEQHRQRENKVFPSAA